LTFKLVVQITKMSDWKTKKTEIVDAGGNNFIEVTLKESPEGEDMFIGFSKGWINFEGEKRYKSNILFKVAQKEAIFNAIESVISEIE